MITKAPKEEGWVLKEAFSVSVAELYGFCLRLQDTVESASKINNS